MRRPAHLAILEAETLLNKVSDTPTVAAIETH